MKPVQEHKDSKVTNLPLENPSESIYISDSKLHIENPIESMLTSPRSNASENFIPSHHLALITQPVLGARSRSRKKSLNKEKLDSMTNSRQSSFHDSPPLILPINRTDTSQYQKKTNHHESSDSGVDLSFSTTSSVQIPQYPSQHIVIHRPLSALNEDSSLDEHQPNSHSPVRLRFPPVHFPRNRSMEDILNNNTYEQQHRSSSFSDERQQKTSFQQENKVKRISDGAILDFHESSSQTNDSSHRRIHYSQTSTNNQQHRSLNDLTNRNSTKIMPNDSNMSTVINNISSTQTIIHKPNTSILKPLRKKTKFNFLVEPSLPLTSSRLAVYDEQINQMTGTTSSSSNQTTPRSNLPQQQIKSKISSPLSHYSTQEQLRAHVNRSVVERQHQTNISNSNRRSLMQQMIPFDASPSKVNNLLLRHHIQQNQPAIIFYPNSNCQNSSCRQIKSNLQILSNDETIGQISEEKRKQMKFKEQEEKKRFKPKDDFESTKFNEVHSKGQEKIKSKENRETIHLKHLSKRQNSQDYVGQRSNFISTQKQQQQKENELISEKNSKKKSDFYDDYHRQRQSIGDRYDSGHSSNINLKINEKNRKQHPLEQITHEQFVQKTKLNGVQLRNKTIQSNADNRHSYGANLLPIQTRPAKVMFTNSRQMSKYDNQQTSRMHSNLSDFKRERETSRLSFISKTDSIQSKQKINDKHFQVQSPTSWSVISKHLTNQIDSSRTPSFHRENSDASSKTYRIINDQQQSSSNNLQVPSGNDQSFHTASHHTYPFTLSPQPQTKDETYTKTSEKSPKVDLYTLSDHEQFEESNDVHYQPPSPLVHFSSKQVYSVPSSPLKKVPISTDKEELVPNYDSDDGWSDDSAELLYVDERYANDKLNSIPSSHLNSQQHYHYHLQQQNVLLQ